MLQSIFQAFILSHFILELALKFFNIISSLLFLKKYFIKIVLLSLNFILKNIFILNSTRICFQQILDFILHRLVFLLQFYNALKTLHEKFDGVHERMFEFLVMTDESNKMLAKIGSYSGCEMNSFSNIVCKVNRFIFNNFMNCFNK